MSVPWVHPKLKTIECACEWINLMNHINSIENEWERESEVYLVKKWFSCANKDWWSLYDVLQIPFVITYTRNTLLNWRPSEWDQMNNIHINETLTHWWINIENQFGKGNQDHIFNSIVNLNGLQFIYGSSVAIPDFLPDSQDQSVSMRVHNDSSPFTHERPLFYRWREGELRVAPH